MSQTSQARTHGDVAESQANKPAIVAEMTPEQIESKRAGDRVNQRWSRARKRSEIEQLKNRNITLHCQNTRLVAQLANAEQELARLRKSYAALQSAVNIAHQIAQQDNHRPLAGDLSLSSHPDSTQVAALGSSPSNIEPIGEAPFDMPLEFGTGLVVNLMHDPSLDSDSQVWPVTDLFSHDSSVSWADTFGAASHASVAIEATPSSRLPPLNVQMAPVWQLLPLHVAPTTALDEVLIEVSESGRQWNRQRGEHHEELLHGGFPSLSTLLKPTMEDSATHPISAAVGKHTTWGTNVIAFPSRVAYHYIVAHMVRWLVCRTEESFNQLPDFLRPTTMQLTVPHPAWVDVFPWTDGRDLIIQNMDYSKFDTLRQVTATFSVNWPYSDSDMFITDSVRNRMVLNPVFEAHIRKLKNWTFGPEALGPFPFLASCCSTEGDI